MRRTPVQVGELFKARRNALALDQTDVGASTATVRKIERGDVGPKTRSTAPYAAAIGWPADAWQRLLDGEDPAALATGSPSGEVGSDLRELLGVPGRLIDERLTEMQGRLVQLEERMDRMLAELEGELR